MNRLAARYLYGLEEPLPRAVVEAYITVLVRVAQANGIVESESQILRGVADCLGAPPFLLSTLLTRPEIDYKSGLEALQGRPVLVTMLYRDAILVALADGHVSSEEESILERVAAELGLDEAARKTAADNVDRLEELRRRILGEPGLDS